MKKIKRFFVGIIALVILYRPWRQHVREVLLEASFKKSVFSYINFKMHKINNNTILLTETNDTHGEVVAGYIQYFQKLGFNIDILVQRKVLEEQPFCRLDLHGCKVFGVSSWHFYKLLRIKTLKQYKYVLVTSLINYAGGCVFDVYPDLTKCESVYVVAHDTNDIIQNKEYLGHINKPIITLGHFKGTIFACPMLFGKVNIKPKNKITTFITVGGIQASRKNYHMLINALSELVNNGYKFKVVVVGNGNINDIPKKIKPYISIRGRLKFPDMFNELEQADFFLPLLDKNTPEHERYITTGVTGSAQLIYAFAKIPVLHPKFASFYKFNQKNAILSDDLSSGMKTAILMKKSEYKTKQKLLIDLSKNIEKESITNLKRIFNK